VKRGIGDLGDFGNPTVGSFEDMLGELSFEFLTDAFDFHFDLIPFMDIKRRGTLHLKRPGSKSMIFPAFHLTIQRDAGILVLG